MTIAELYEWACREGVENCDLVVRGLDGSQTYYIVADIVHHVCSDGTEYIEVEL